VSFERIFIEEGAFTKGTLSWPVQDAGLPCNRKGKGGYTIFSLRILAHFQ